MAQRKMFATIPTIYTKGFVSVAHTALKNVIFSKTK